MEPGRPAQLGQPAQPGQQAGGGQVGYQPAGQQTQSGPQLEQQMPSPLVLAQTIDILRRQGEQQQLTINQQNAQHQQLLERVNIVLSNVPQLQSLAQQPSHAPSHSQPQQQSQEHPSNTSQQLQPGGPQLLTGNTKLPTLHSHNWKTWRVELGVTPSQEAFWQPATLPGASLGAAALHPAQQQESVLADLQRSRSLCTDLLHSGRLELEEMASFLQLKERHLQLGAQQERQQLSQAAAAALAHAPSRGIVSQGRGRSTARGPSTWTSNIAAARQQEATAAPKAAGTNGVFKQDVVCLKCRHEGRFQSACRRKPSASQQQ
ncbi:hypothetical protein DUNSADRAFT_9336 [Dunaliella salina]|uniref:Encoded protein n=1 Tax=Dunaliella salina TaxID=3046 RepID=A0ABQ7H5E2_DUNSA|nr:hypothetical protein DUNSADRAFT_9336 [Dunaliella salina]|eukprot:KAF5842077.1 hypothetical protein DUNSADRAFT_9336 [Dunaliella salina]